MSRISIDVTVEQHNQLKAVAALAGKSLKEYVLEKTLPQKTGEEARALKDLQNFLKPRVEEVKKGLMSKKTVRQIADEVLKERKK